MPRIQSAGEVSDMTDHKAHAEAGRRLAVLLAIVVACAGCERRVEQISGGIVGEPIAKLSGAGVYATVLRVDDQERGVTCYALIGDYKGGIDCSPTHARALLAATEVQP